MMKNIRSYLPVYFVVAVVLFSATVLGRTTRSNTISVTVTNSSQKEIRHLFVAAGDPNNWGPDRLTSAISTNGSFTLNDVSCDGEGVQVIAEDQNGCFYYTNVSCGGNGTVTITDSSPADCGN
jgi:hypothetical protein